jgi:hypothetical protein
MKDDLGTVTLLFDFFVRVFAEGCCCFFRFALRTDGDFEF